MIEKQGNHLFNKNTLARPAAVALGILALSGNLVAPALARSKAVTPHEQPAPLTTPLVIDPAAILKSRLVHKEVVTFDAAQIVNGIEAPLTADVNGETDYFSVTQTNPKHGTLRTLQVTELTGITPDSVLPAVWPGVDNDATLSQSGVVNARTVGATPVVEVFYNGNQHFNASVGQAVTQPAPVSPTA